MNDRQKGCLFVIVSGIIFGAMPLMAKYIYAGGGNAMSLVFYRSFFALPVLYILMRKHWEVSRSVTKREMKQIALLTLFGFALTPMLLYSSYNYIASGVATTVHFTYPVFVLIGCALLFREKIGAVKGICVTICTLGIAALCDVKAGFHLNGFILAAASGISYAFYIIYMDKSNLKSMFHFKLAFYTALVTAVFLLFYTAATGTLCLRMTASAWILSFIFANIVTVGAVVLFQIGIKKIGPQNTAILSTFEPLTSIILGICLLGEPFTFKIGVGILLILLSVTVLTFADAPTERKHSEQESSGTP